LTKSKEDTTHNRRIVFSYLKSKESIKSLFGEVSEKIANRNGGYTRIIKLGTRLGDAAETALIELVDYNELLLTTSNEAPAKAKRTRRAGKKADGVTTTQADASPITDAVVLEDEVKPVSDEVAQDEIAISSDDEGSDSVSDNTTETDEEPKSEV
jgi:large subunit ribosomal protein L17